MVSSPLGGSRGWKSICEVLRLVLRRWVLVGSPPSAYVILEVASSFLKRPRGWKEVYKVVWSALKRLPRPWTPYVTFEVIWLLLKDLSCPSRCQIVFKAFKSFSNSIKSSLLCLSWSRSATQVNLETICLFSRTCSVSKFLFRPPCVVLKSSYKSSSKCF